MRSFGYVSITLAVILTGCTGEREGAVPDGEPEAGREEPVDRTAAHAAGLRLDEMARCDARKPTCELYGQLGDCVRGFCVIGRGFCTQDIDCDDGNECTADRCERGICANDVEAKARQSCGGDAVGAWMCQYGNCERSDLTCRTDDDCHTSNPCLERSCHPEGFCDMEPRPDGTECKTVSGLAGACRSGMCRPDWSEAQDPEKKCRLVWRPYRGYVRRCSGALRYALTPGELEEAEEKLEKAIADRLRYDMRVATVRLSDGGYNIVAYNRKGRDEIRGLCDPSFVAFEVADFTRGTDWKSRQLHIWLKPYVEGWAIPTRGSRTAVRKGRQASILGSLGVMAIKPFRKWLEANFRPLPARWLAEQTEGGPGRSEAR